MLIYFQHIAACTESAAQISAQRCSDGGLFTSTKQMCVYGYLSFLPPVSDLLPTDVRLWLQLLLHKPHGSLWHPGGDTNLKFPNVAQTLTEFLENQEQQSKLKRRKT